MNGEEGRRWGRSGTGGLAGNANSIMNRYLLRNNLESVLKVSKFLRSLEVLSLGLKR